MTISYIILFSFTSTVSIQRQARLEQLRSNQQHRTASETPEQRQARLEQLRSNQQRRTAFETPEQRQVHLEQHQALHHLSREFNPQSSHFEQPAVHSKMAKFHRTMESLQFHGCSTCAECFPNMNVVTRSNGVQECRRCSNDKRIPKVYSSANNMNPGQVPLQLKVTSIIPITVLSCNAYDQLLSSIYVMIFSHTYTL